MLGNCSGGNEGKSMIYDQERAIDRYGKFNERMSILHQNSIYGKGAIKEMLAKEKEISQLESEHRIMKNALIDLAKREDNDYAAWIINILFGGTSHGAE
ncbi:hypothetical protein Goe23_00030 [Bacillus phage vB_BsuP-Goe23]|nr:hypothetical protein Goe23_00030 [Bacillus phage vB_BsuP-Goe23]